MRALFRIVLLAVVLGLMIGGYVAWNHLNPVKPWATSSPRTQGGIRLIAIQPKPPREIGSSHVGWKEPTQYAWFEVTDASLKIPDHRRLCQNFAIVGKNGQRAYLDGWDFGDSPSRKGKYIEVAIPLDYSPNYENGTLIALSEGKTIGEWKIAGMPKAERRIAKNEPPVTEAEAMGYRVKLHGKPTSVAELTHNPNARIKDWRFDVDVIPITDETKKTTDVLSYDIDLTRTTWQKYKDPRMMAVCGSQNRLTIGQATGFANDVEAVEVFITLKRQRTYDEPVTLHNLRVEPELLKMQVQAPETVETPSGIRFTVLKGDVQAVRYPLSMSLPLKMECDYKDVFLDKSPLCKEANKPVQISLRNPHFNQGATGLSYGDDPKTLTAHFGYVPSQRKGGYTLSKLDLLVRQTALIEKKTVRLLVPIRG